MFTSFSCYPYHIGFLNIHITQVSWLIYFVLDECQPNYFRTDKDSFFFSKIKDNFKIDQLTPNSSKKIDQFIIQFKRTSYKLIILDTPRIHLSLRNKHRYRKRKTHQTAKIIINKKAKIIIPWMSSIIAENIFIIYRSLIYIP